MSDTTTMTIEDAERMAREDAADAIAIARDSGSDPIAWITGNSYMPPLRDFGQAETVWQSIDAQTWGGGDDDPWVAYVETFESTLDAADVLLTGPEYDNALYVVDLRRFEYDEDEAEDGETLQSEWKPKGA